MSRHKLVIYVSACSVIFLKGPKYNGNLRFYVNINHMREREKYTSRIFLLYVINQIC